MQKQITMSVGNLDTSLEHLLKVKNTYQLEHPEVSEAIEAVMLVILQARELADRLHIVF